MHRSDAIRFWSGDTQEIGPGLTLILGANGLGKSTLVFCTYGLHGAVSDEAMLGILKGEPDLQKAATALINAALDDGGRDNVTVVLARTS